MHVSALLGIGFSLTNTCNKMHTFDVCYCAALHQAAVSYAYRNGLMPYLQEPTLDGCIILEQFPVAESSMQL